MSGKPPFLRTGPVRRRLSRIAAPAAWLRSLCHFAGLRIGRVKPSDTPDNNGAGDPRTVVVDVPAFGNVLKWNVD